MSNSRARVSADQRCGSVGTGTSYQALLCATDIVPNSTSAESRRQSVNWFTLCLLPHVADLEVESELCPGCNSLQRKPCTLLCSDSNSE